VCVCVCVCARARARSNMAPGPGKFLLRLVGVNSLNLTTRFLRMKCRNIDGLICPRDASYFL
jgi:hypothetical protein